MIISTLKKEMGFIPVHRYILQEKINTYTLNGKTNILIWNTP